MSLADEPRVILYTTHWCPLCPSAKALLARRGIAFREIDAEREWGAQFRDRLFQLCGQLTVPQVVVDGEPIGGYSDLVRLDETGELRQLLARPAPGGAGPVGGAGRG